MSKKIIVEKYSNEIATSAYIGAGIIMNGEVKVIHLDNKNRKQFIDFQDRKTLSEDERLNVYPTMPKWVK